ncbi:MAG: circadian clock KaiB family protein [Deltaproteobacteria bacterium]|nr:circadian clock KaiB family protein [Deltaproteobacteria bacterium]MBW2066028.1 circadian clock KaiB family protein [Deltaproteobacteria bacterium]
MARRAAIKDASKTFEKGLSSSEKQFYNLSLYVAGMTSRSLRTVDNIKDLCADHLEGRYDLEVIDIYQTPKRALEDQIVAVPTLIKRSPGPVRRLIGDLSLKERALAGLSL